MPHTRLRHRFMNARASQKKNNAWDLLKNTPAKEGGKSIYKKRQIKHRKILMAIEVGVVGIQEFIASMLMGFP